MEEAIIPRIGDQAGCPNATIKKAKQTKAKPTRKACLIDRLA